MWDNLRVIDIVTKAKDLPEIDISGGLMLRNGHELKKFRTSKNHTIDTKNLNIFYGNSELLAPGICSIWFNLTSDDYSYLTKTVSRFYSDKHNIFILSKNETENFTKTIVSEMGNYPNTEAILIPAVKDLLKSQHTITDIRLIIAALRAENGCPWDKEQTMESMKRPLIEESYEVIEAISKGTEREIAEELGDLLLNIIFIAQLGEEDKAFTFDDSIEELGQKLIRRHTHVFGDVEAKNGNAALKNWEEVKKEEKKSENNDIFHNIPLAFPALTRAQKIQKTAASVGFDWENLDGAVQKFYEEVDEFNAAMENNMGIDEVRDEIGDLFFTLVNICRFLHLDAESLVRDSNDKFLGRFQKMINLAVEKNINFLKSSLDEKEKLWQEIK